MSAEEMRDPEQIAKFMGEVVEQQLDRQQDYNQELIEVGDIVLVDVPGFHPKEEYWVLEKKGNQYRIGKEGFTTANEQWIDAKHICLVGGKYDID